MCYSAKVVQKWRDFRRVSGVRLDLAEFHRIYHLRDRDEAAARIPRGFDLEFADPQTDTERQIRALVLARRRRRGAELEAGLFTQRQRLADAQRRMQVRPSRAAAESARIASARVQQDLARLALLRDDTPQEGDYRIFPFSHAPVIIQHGTERLLTPARYQLRPPGKPASIDRRLSLFNARRDNLAGSFWRPLFGVSHAILPAVAFYENVRDAHGSNRVLEFTPRDGATMWIACLFARWVNPADPADCLQGFAAVTDEPPAEVAATGHDRIPVNLTWEAACAWLTPGGRRDAELFALMDKGRQRPGYGHREAA